MSIGINPEVFKHYAFSLILKILFEGLPSSLRSLIHLDVLPTVTTSELKYVMNQALLTDTHF